MFQSKICLITPSYKPDFNRCKLLCETKEKFSSEYLKHYLIVDQPDVKLFKQLENDSTEVISVNDVLPKWLIKLPYTRKKNIWINLKGLPVRGWLVQQLIKLNIANYVKEDTLIFGDSDTFFVKEFNLNNYNTNNTSRLFAQPNEVNQDHSLARWYHDAATVLKTEVPKFPATNYLGNLIYWRKENVFKLHKYIEDQHQKNWMQVICNNWNISEYILYGVFVENILKENNNHTADSFDLCHNYWEQKALNESNIKNFFSEIKTGQIAAMISAKANIKTESYKSLINYNEIFCISK